MNFISNFIKHILGKRGNGRHNGEFLYTIGYEGLQVEDFVNRLKENNVKVLADVREIPWSRKKGFSKSQIENAVNQQGIKYIHLKKLGSPSALRKEVKKNGDYEQFFDEYEGYLETQKEELQSLLNLVENTICCLMCFEKDVGVCHRKIIASEVKRIDRNGLQVVHL